MVQCFPFLLEKNSPNCDSYSRSSERRFAAIPRTIRTITAMTAYSTANIPSRTNIAPKSAYAFGMTMNTSEKAMS